MTMSAVQWLQIVALGILLGAVGQGARTIVGIKKLNDYADESTPARAMIDGIRMFISFGIGGVAGAFAAISIIKDLANVPPEQLFAIAAAGYAGADFIEGFISRISSSQQKTQAATPATPPKASSDDAVG
ncbi:MAG TPA: hypothetical protein VGO01_05815 [Bradyrhizobium sp.]|jgi:hypothetical protein|nr:hypothetical protein [Bradyrhizobium sp.]